MMDDDDVRWKGDAEMKVLLLELEVRRAALRSESRASPCACPRMGSMNERGFV